MLTNDDFLVHLHVELTLWWYLVEATATGITLYIHNTQTIACILTDALETLQQTALYLEFQVLCLCLEDILLFASLLHDFIQFATLVVKVTLTSLQLFLGLLESHLTVLNTLLCFVDFLLTEFYLQSLEFYLLSQGVVLTIVLYVIELLVVAATARA